MLALIFRVAQEAAEDPGIRRIAPHSDEFVWGSIAFAIIAIVMMKLVGPKMKQTVAARTERIRGQLEAAERTKMEAEGVLEQYRAQLADARNEGNRVIEESKKTAEALRKDLIAKAEAEAAEIINRARAEVGAERDRALAELRGTIGELSLKLAERVLGRELANEAAQRAFIDQTLAELVATAGNGQRS
jgi:F-type H+-transporting ATPase subunit b